MTLARTPYARLSPADIGQVDRELKKLEQMTAGLFVPKTIVHARSPYTVQGTDTMLLCDCTAGPITLTFPLAARVDGMTVQVVKSDTSANAVTLSGTFSGVVNPTITVAHGGFTVVAMNGAYHVTALVTYPVLAAEGSSVKNIVYPYGDLRRYGGIGAGSAGDSAVNTTAFQAAVNYFGTNGGRIIIEGEYYFTPPTWPVGLARPLTLQVNGILHPSTTFTLPDFVFWDGIGGSRSFIQFLRGPSAEIVPPAGNIPTLHITGATSHRVVGLTIYQPTGIGIYCDGVTGLGALIDFERVGVLSKSGVATSEPIVFDGFFWGFCRNCAFLGDVGTAGRSMRFTASGTTYSNGTGLVYVDDTIISGYGIQVDAQVNVTQMGNLFFRNITFENCRSSMFILDPTHGPIGNIEMHQVGTSDEIAITTFINIVAPGNVNDITITQSDIPLIPITNRVISGLRWDGSRNFDYATGWSLGSATQREYSLHRRGYLDAELAAQGALVGPSAAPFATLNVEQDVTKWAARTGTATVVTGQRAPDGSLTAAKLTSGAGIADKEVYRVNQLLHAGDWVVAGCWIRADDPTQAPGEQSLIAMVGGGLFDLPSGTNNFFPLSNDAVRQVTGQWKQVVLANKIASAPGTNCDLVFDIKTEATNAVHFWKPWMILVPASAGITDDEIVRWKRHLRNLGQNLVAGALGLYPHQQMWWGPDTSFGRNSAGLLATNGGFAEPVIAKSGTYTATATDACILVSAAAPWTLTLPAATGLAGKTYTAKKTDANANLITVNGGGTNIDAAATYTGLSAQGKYVKVVSDGTQWWVIAAN